MKKFNLVYIPVFFAGALAGAILLATQGEKLPMTPDDISAAVGAVPGFKECTFAEFSVNGKTLRIVRCPESSVTSQLEGEEEVTTDKNGNIVADKPLPAPGDRL